MTVPAKDVFAKPSTSTSVGGQPAACRHHGRRHAPRRTADPAGGTVIVHGASGATGVLLLQLLRARGVRAIWTASGGRFAEEVRRFGGEPIAYGDGLAEGAQALGTDGFDAAYDCVGTDEAIGQYPRRPTRPSTT